MRTVKIGEIVENATRLAGYDPTTAGVPDNWRVTIAFAVREGWRKLYEAKLPVMRVVEFRRYRPTWTAAGGFTSAEGAQMECWYAEHYWRLAVGGDGTVAPSLAAGNPWELIKDGMAKFVALDQPWEGTVIDPAGINIEAFAYAADPTYWPKAAALHGCELADGAVVLPPNAPDGVYCRFTPEVPKVCVTEWATGAEYVEGDVCYVTADKEMYRCVADVTSGTAPGSDAEHWEAVRAPEFAEAYLTKLAGSYLLTQDTGRFQTKAEADHELEEIVTKYTQDVGACRPKVGRGFGGNY